IGPPGWLRWLALVKWPVNAAGRPTWLRRGSSIEAAGRVSWRKPWCRTRYWGLFTAGKSRRGRERAGACSWYSWRGPEVIKFPGGGRGSRRLRDRRNLWLELLTCRWYVLACRECGRPFLSRWNDAQSRSIFNARRSARPRRRGSRRNLLIRRTGV